jgi:hypothetical protein
VRNAITRGFGRQAALCVLAIAALAACTDTRRTLLSGTASPLPPEIKEACALTATRCSHCHPIERVIVTRGIGIAKWEMVIDQMRLKPSSGISPDDAKTIARCLRFVEESCTDCKRGRS